MTKRVEVICIEVQSS